MHLGYILHLPIQKILVYLSGNAMPVHPVDHTRVALVMGLRLGPHWAINGLHNSHCFSFPTDPEKSCILYWRVASHIKDNVERSERQS